MSETPTPSRGVLLRAKNGDVIGFDETGLRLRLADEVIADIASRLPQLGSAQEVDPAVLGDIDAWDVKTIANEYVFSARLAGEQGVRKFRRPIQSGGMPDTIANPSGALFAMFGLGGARRTTGQAHDLRFPWHIVTAGDDLGATGNAGSDTNLETSALYCLPEQTRDSLIADEIVARRQEAYRALPVIFSRSESDNSGCITDLAVGIGMSNLTQSVKNFVSAARRLGLPPKVLGVGLEFTLEDVLSSEAEWQSGIFKTMDAVCDLFSDQGLRKPLFVSVFDAGTQNISDHTTIRAQWALSWNSGSHDFVFSAPSYMFALDTYGRPTRDACLQMAEMDASAVEALNEDQTWSCPVLLLAEREDDPTIIRCRGQAETKFVLDSDDPLNSGDACGFQFENDDAGAKIIAVQVAADDPNDVLITCDKPPQGTNLTLLYAIGHTPSNDGMPANRGALRDRWSLKSRTGVRLHRWALPAALPVH